MTDFQKLVGPKANKITVGRFYHVIDADGEHVIAQASADSWGVIVATVKPRIDSNVHSYRNGNNVSFLGTQALGRTVYKFTQAPDTVRYRGKQVTSREQLTVGRWYILIDRDGAEYSGQYAAQQHGPVILFTLDDESATRRGHSFRFAVNMDGTSLRKVYKFTQVPKAQPKPVATHAPAAEPAEGADDHPPMQCYPLGTTCRKIGAQIGDKFIFVDSGEHHIPWDKCVTKPPRIARGQLVTLVEDDGTACPYFTFDGCSGQEPIFFSRLAPYVVEPAPAQEAANDDVWDDIPIGPKPDPAVFKKAMEAVDLQRASRAIGLLAHEVQKRYDVAQEAVKAHTVAVQALENAQRDLIELAKKATANESI